MPPFTEQQSEVINLFTKIIELCQIFVNTCVKLFDNVVTVLVTPLYRLAPQWLSMFVDISPIFAPLKPILDWLSQNPSSFLGQITVLELILGSGFTFYLAYTLIKWILDIVL